MFTMTGKYTGAAFNHFCLKVPVNPSNKQPLTSFERKHTGNTFDTNKKCLRKGKAGKQYGFTPSLDQFSSTDSREFRSKSSTPQYNETAKGMHESENKASMKTYLNFYESIPDYGDVNHLSDREFYGKLKDLKAKQKTYLRDLDQKEFDRNEVVDGGNVNSTGNFIPERENYSPSTSRSIMSHKCQVSGNELNLRGKKYGLDDRTSTSLDYKKKDKAYSDPYVGSYSPYWKQFDKKYCTGMYSSPIASPVTPEHENKTTRNIPKPSIQLNNYLVNSKDCIDKHKYDIPVIITKPPVEEELNIMKDLTHSDLYNAKAKVTYSNGTNKVRDTHSASTNRADDSSSTVTGVGSLCDGQSIYDCIPKAKVPVLSDSESEQDDMIGIQLMDSIPNSPAVKQNKNVVWREPKITIPKPFNMTVREEEDRHINYLRYRLYGDVILDEPKDETHIIKAHPVPIESQIPLFDKIMAEQENRRRQVRRQCMNELRAQMKPFRFVKRDEENKFLRLCHSSPDLRDFGDSSTKAKPFKARPVPKNLFSNYVYQRMREDEFYRALKRKVRAEELLKSSSLPPSMAARERRSKARALSAEMLNSDPDKPKRRKHKIPNYKKSHDFMKRELEERWNENVTTSPQPFTLQTSHLHPRKSARFISPNSSSSGSPYVRLSSPGSAEKIWPGSTLGIPLNRNNLASVLRIQSSRQKMEQEQTARQEEIRRREEARLKANVTRKKPAWQSLNYSTEEDLEMRIQTRREEERIRREEYEHDMELMLQRVCRIPTLFERQSQRQPKESRRSPKKFRRRSGHSIKISSVPTTPDLYEDEEEEEDYINPSDTSEKNTKAGLKVSISETPETVECPSEPEYMARYDINNKVNKENNENEKVHNTKTNICFEETKESKDTEEKDEDECENTESIPEDISAGNDDAHQDEDDDDDAASGNTYNVDD